MNADQVPRSFGNFLKNPSKVHSIGYYDQDDSNIKEPSDDQEENGGKLIHSIKRTRSAINGTVVTRLIGGSKSSATLLSPNTARSPSIILENFDAVLILNDVKSLRYLLWILAGIIMGLSAVKIGFASFKFGDPTILSGVGFLDCAFICSSVWMVIFCGTNISIIYELIVKRVISQDSYHVPNIPYLQLKFCVSVLIASASCLSLWIGLYKIFSTMVPFHGIISASFGGVMQGIYFCVFLIPKSYYIEHKELKWKIPIGIGGVIVGMVLFPVMVYVAALVIYQLTVTFQNSTGLDYLALCLFPITRMTLIYTLKCLMKKIFGEIADDLVIMLVFSLVSILHNSFFCVSLESSTGYNAVIFSITINTFYSIHRVLVLAYGIDLDLYASIFSYRTFGYGWSCYSSGGQRYKKFDTEEESIQNSLILREEDRVFYTLEFLSWETFKFIVPLMYLAAVWIIAKGPNAVWMAGIGRVAFQYNHTLTDDASLNEVTHKILILVSVDSFVFLIELFILQKLKFNLLGFLCFACKEFGNCLCFLLAFMPVTQLCITAIHCGMDFSMRFKWLESNQNVY